MTELLDKDMMPFSTEPNGTICNCLSEKGRALFVMVVCFQGQVIQRMLVLPFVCDWLAT